MNKYDDLTGVVLYNSKWDKGMSLGSYNNIIEVVVEDNIVTDIRQGADPIQIPENGYVLATLIDHVAFLKDNFAVGDEVKLDLSVSPSLGSAKTAFGGGAVLVDNGTIPKSFSHNISGVNPRTALGVDASGKKVFLVTVDGRQAVGKGMTQTELAQLMVELGAYNAINLDGGGSTTMVTRDFWEEKLSVKNAPSDGGLRAVVNGLGITSQKGDGIAGVRLEAPGYTFVGAPVALTVGGHDAYQNPLPLPDAQNVSYTVTGAGGSVSGGVFTPAAPGVATITASYGASSYSVDIMVYEPARLNISPRQISMGQGGSAAVSITATSADGYSAPPAPFGGNGGQRHGGFAGRRHAVRRAKRQPGGGLFGGQRHGLCPGNSGGRGNCRRL